ncbi:MAG TPA: aminotransferase class V-fold PLP-dependent enzyme, partial [Actinomycetales bacterium]|nr:aminotransferase class V-fold PLP-dependent enzyme [Actinomycetales bacterium]
PTTAPAAAPTTGARPAASIRLPRSTPLPSSARLPHITHVIFEGLRAEALLFALDRAGISASAGSACRAGVHQPSHVVLAMGGSEEQASATLRCSLGWTTTQADVDALVGALPTAVDRARAAGATRL